MAFTLPDFNTTFDLWVYPNGPGVGAADLSNIPCQLYRNSRGGDSNTPRAQLRMSTTDALLIAFPPVSGALGNPRIECPSGSGNFYRIDRGEFLHKDFPNEYVQADVTPCNATTPWATIDSDTSLL
jgi:hypothetical protein